MNKNATEMTQEEKREFYQNHGIFGLMSGDSIDMCTVQKELQNNIDSLLDDDPKTLVDLERLFAPKEA